MAPPAIIRGKVLSGPRPVAGARVYFHSGPTALPDIAAMSGSDGSFVLSAPVNGAYQISATADGFDPVTATVHVKGGQGPSVTLRLTSS
jgi:hypothetical protein